MKKIPPWVAWIKRNHSQIKFIKLPTGRLAIYQELDHAMRDEHTIISMCRENKRKTVQFELVRITGIQTIMKVGKYGRITQSKKTDSPAR